MKRFLTLIAATAAGLAAFAYAGGLRIRRRGPAITCDAAPDAVDDPTTQSDPAATAQSSTSTTGQSTRLAAIVPAGMSAQEACAGFRSVEECVATLHVSQNLSIPFPDLKSKVTGVQSSVRPFTS